MKFKLFVAIAMLHVTALRADDTVEQIEMLRK